jgi:hypothetical protein
MQAVQLPALRTSGGAVVARGPTRWLKGPCQGGSQPALSGVKASTGDRPSCRSWTSKCAARARYAAAWSGRPSRVSTSAEDRHAPAWCSSCRCVGSTTRAASSRKGSRVMSSSLGPPGTTLSWLTGGVGIGGPISRVQELRSCDLSHVWTVAECRTRHPRPCAAGGWPCLPRRGRDRCQGRVKIDPLSPRAGASRSVFRRQRQSLV